MKVYPIQHNYQNPTFQSRFAPTKEFNDFQRVITNANHPLYKNYAAVFKKQYSKFLNDGEDICYKFYHQKSKVPASKKTYNLPAIELRAIIENDKGKVISSELMDLQIESNEKIIKPRLISEMALFQKFLKFPEKHKPFYVSDICPEFKFAEWAIRIIRPYSTSDFVKEPFIPDL